MAFVARDDIHLIAFNLTFQDGWFLLIRNLLAEPHGHLLSLRDRQIQFTGDLAIRQVEPHEIRAQHPNPQRLMVPRENGVGQIIKTTVTFAAAISLATRFGRIVPVLDDLTAIAMRTTNTLRPAQIAYHLITLCIVNQAVNCNGHP